MFPLQNLARKELNDTLSIGIDIDALRDVCACATIAKHYANIL